MIQAHANFIFMSYLAFLLAVVTGLLFLVQEHQIKHKNPQILLFSWFPLEVLDRVNWFSVVLGFALFTIGIFQGHLLSRIEWGAFFTGHLKQVLGLMTWVSYGLVLVLRLKFGFKGRRVVWVSVMAFCLAVFTYWAVNHSLEGMYQFG